MTAMATGNFWGYYKALRLPLSSGMVVFFCHGLPERLGGTQKTMGKQNWASSKRVYWESMM